MFCLSSSLVIMLFKQQLILIENGVKDSLLIGQYGAGFRNSVVGIRSLKRWNACSVKQNETGTDLWAKVQFYWISHMLPIWQCPSTCCQEDNARLHVAKMTMLGHMLPRHQCSATYSDYDNAPPHVDRMIMLGHKLPMWQCSATCCQYDNARSATYCDYDNARSHVTKMTILGASCQDINARPHIATMTMLGHMLTGW